jgi:spore maturation protein CgeB
MALKILLLHPGASVSTADYYSGYLGALRRLGHEVTEYRLDNGIELGTGFLEYAWRRRKKYDLGAERPTLEDRWYWAGKDSVLIALDRRVDWVVIVSAMYLHHRIPLLMRRAGLRVCLMLTESPYDDAQQGPYARLADAVTTNERASLDTLRRFNPNVSYLPHAYDPERHAPYRPDIEPDVAAHDVVFVGTLFQERIEVLSAVDWDGLGIDLGLYGIHDLLPPRHRLRRYVRGGMVDNAETVALYRKAKIGLNLHRTSRGFGKDAPRTLVGESLNPRAYELAACGVFTVSDYRAEVPEVFGGLVPTFRDPAELGPLLTRWLADDGGRAAASARLPVCVAGRTFDARAASLVGGVLERAGRAA